MVKTDEVLRTLLEMGFGCVSLNEAMFRGRGCTDPCIPKSYFATDRLGKHPDAPVDLLHIFKQVSEGIRICLKC